MFSKWILKIYLLAVLIIYSSIGYGNEVSSEDNVVNHIYTLRSEVDSFQNSIGKEIPTTENMAKIIEELSSTLVLVLTELESTNSFQENIIVKVSNLGSEINETRCSLSTRLIDVENDVNTLKTGSIATPTAAPRAIPEGNIFKVIRRPKLSDENFFLTPSTNYMAARKYCRSHGANPFIPTTEEELHYIMERTMGENDYGWLPLTDLINEGDGEWDDGTAYEDGPIKLSFIDADGNDGNTRSFDCVDLNRKRYADWYDCYKDRRLLCAKIL